jgi:hypothetical protein
MRGRASGAKPTATSWRGLAACALLLGLAACAAGSEASNQAAQAGSVSEVVLGFWHGLIAPIALIGEIINRISPGTLPWSFKLYEVRNLGVLYDLGFYLGLVAGPSILWTGASRRRGGV